MEIQVTDAERGDLAAVRAVIEEYGMDADEKDLVRNLLLLWNC